MPCQALNRLADEKIRSTRESRFACPPFHPDDKKAPVKGLPGENGIFTVNTKELERVVLHLNGPGKAINGAYHDAYQVLNGRLEALPTGSTFDSEKGIFYWLPGPGFLGRYEFVFIRTGENGLPTRRNVTVNIGAKF